MDYALTPWFDATKTTPVRCGMYDFCDGFFGTVRRLYWNGKTWESPCGYRFDVYAFDKWRGILKDEQ